MKTYTSLLCILLMFTCTGRLEAKQPVYVTCSGGHGMSSSAQEVAPPAYCTNTGGCGYRASQKAPYKFAAVAFAAVLIGLIIYVALQKESSDLVHAHHDSTSN